MAQDKADLVRRLLDAYSRGDYGAATESVHQDVVLVPPGGQAPYRGIDKVRDWMTPDAFAKQESEARDIRVVNDNLLFVHQHSRLTGAGSGIEIEADFWTVWTFDDAGLITQVEAFLDLEPALGAAGLSE